MASHSSFGGLDKCNLCGGEIEGRGERRVSLEGCTYIFCNKCAAERRERINELLKLRDQD